MNLMSEIVGIGITVAVIDAIIKRDNDNRLKPTRQYVFITSNETLNVSINKLDSFVKANSIIHVNYDYGEVPCFRVVGDRNTLMLDVLKKLKLRVQGDKDNLDSEAAGVGAAIDYASKKLSRIIGKYVTMLEPETTKYIIGIEQSRKFYLNLIDNWESYEIEVREFLLAESVCQFLDAVNIYQTYLIKEANSYIANDEWMDRANSFLKKAKAQVEQLNIQH